MKSGMAKGGIRLFCMLVMSIVLLMAAGTMAIASDPLIWEAKAPLPTVMSRMDATVLNNQIYVVGEMDVLQYEPDVDQWTFAMPPSEQVFYPSILTLDDKIYMIGGDARGSGMSDTQGIWIYDPATGGYRVASTLEPRFFADATALNSKIYIVGGSEVDSLTLSLSIEEFDPATGISQVVGQIPAGRFLPAVETDGEWIYILGGQDETGIATDSCWAFNPVTGEFREKTPMLTPVWNRSAFAALGKIYLVGGVTGPGGPFVGPPTEWTMDIQEYNPLTDIWKVVGQVPSSRYTPAVALAGDTFYVIGGDTGQNGPIMSVNTNIVEAAILTPGLNLPPVCTGTPATSVLQDQLYSFTPDCLDPDGDPLNFSVDNQPLWTIFDPATGTLSGTPTNDDVNNYNDIVITVTDSNMNSTALKFGDFALTTGIYAGASDWESAVGSELASEYRVADWSDLVDYDTSGGDLVTLMDGLGFGYNNVHAFVTYNGIKQWPLDPTRYYFISRHDHQSPSTYLVHTELDNNLIVLGSWYDPRPILAFKNLPVTLPAFNIEVINVNEAPDCSGTPDTEVIAGTFYSFTPICTDADGDTLLFMIENQPVWASYNHATGTLSGTPAVADAGPYNDIKVTVSDGTDSVAINPFAVNVYEELVVNAYEKKYYLGQYLKSAFYVTGGVAPYTVALDSGSFPPGVDFLTTTLTQSMSRYGGTPTEMGTWSFSIKATDSEGRTAVSSVVSIQVVEGVVITTTSLPDAVVGQPYTATIDAAGGVNNGNFAWWMRIDGYQIPAGLSFPAGLTFSPEDYLNLSDTATISGIPTTAGTYEFVVDAMEVMWGGYDRVTFTINVVDPCTDSDGDEYAVEGGTCGPVDCNDADPSVFPGAVEIVNDGIDQDCNGYDLTIIVTKANYNTKKSELHVTATSLYGAAAILELEGYGPMNWNAGKRQWELKARAMAPAAVPGSVTVSGLEGSDSLPVKWK